MHAQYDARTYGMELSRAPSHFMIAPCALHMFLCLASLQRRGETTLSMHVVDASADARLRLIDYLYLILDLW